MTNASREGLYEAGAVTVPKAVQEFGIGRTKLFELIRSQELPVARVGRRLLISRKGLEQLLERSTELATA